jgi:hypothetical protein
VRDDAIIDGVLAQLRALIPGADVELERGPQDLDPGPSPDFAVRIRLDSLQFLIVGVVHGDGSSASLRHGLERVSLVSRSLEDSIGVVAAPYLSADRRVLVRDAGLGYVDLSGNAYLRYQSLFVMVDGERNRFDREPGSRGPFSGKASLVPELLIEEPRPWGVRVLGRLAEAGHLSKNSDGKVLASKPEELLNDWTAAYKLPKGRQLKRFAQAPSPDRVVGRLQAASSGQPFAYALGNQAGAFVVAPFAAIDRLDVYIGDRAAEEWIEQALELRDAERGANVILHMLADPDDAVMRRRRIVDGLWVVSDPRLYLDLRNYPRRGLEQAEHLLEKVLRPRWEPS